MANRKTATMRLVIVGAVIVGIILLTRRAEAAPLPPGTLGPTEWQTAEELLTPIPVKIPTGVIVGTGIEKGYILMRNKRIPTLTAWVPPTWVGNYLAGDWIYA